MKDICGTCGTVEQNQQSGYCINGHDNWLQNGDDIEYWEKAAKDLDTSIETLKYCMENGVDLNEALSIIVNSKK